MLVAKLHIRFQAFLAGAAGMMSIFCLKLQDYAEGWGSTFLVNVGIDLEPTQRNNPADYHLGRWF